MSWTDWTSGEWLGKWMPKWPAAAGPGVLPDAIAESLSRLVDVFGFSPARFLHDTVSVASRSLIDHGLETKIGGEIVRFVLGALSVDPPQYGPLVGQFGEIAVEVRDVRWRDRRVERLRIRAENVHIQPGVPAKIVAAPVSLSATLDPGEIADLLAQTTERVVIHLAGGVATAAYAGRESWGYVEIVPQLHGQTVRLLPVALVIKGRRLAGSSLRRLARLVPDVELPLPASPRSGHFTDVVVEGDRLRVDAVVDEWREPLAPGQLQDFERRLRRCGPEDFRLIRAPLPATSHQSDPAGQT